ncbi:MAG: hypothetical protein VX589_16990 [Myxococcota bacterium]|nr:hypothetical protein [Myxococcota bacterium]
MNMKRIILNVAIGVCFCLSTGAYAAEKKSDQKVSVTIKKSSVTKSGYYLMVDFDYFHSKIVSGLGLMKVRTVGAKAPFVNIKSQIQQTAPDSFGGSAKSKTAEWKKSSHPGVFKKLVCGQKVALAYSLEDTNGMKTIYRTTKTIVKPSPARTQLRAQICPSFPHRKLLKGPIRVTPKKRSITVPGNKR